MNHQIASLIAQRDDYRAQCERLAAQNLAMRAELQAFVDKVDSGMARSTESYGRMKTALAAPVEPLVARFNAADALAEQYCVSREGRYERDLIDKWLSDAHQAYLGTLGAAK